MRVVKNVSAQSAFVLIALLAIAPLALASTSTKHSSSTSVKSTTTSNKAHSSTHSSSKKTSSKSTHKHGKTTHTAKKSWKSKGQHGISSDRAKEIQDALIQQHYLSPADATGTWDSKTQEACRKLQADNGWQTKVLPDSRALIKLGLGPDHKDVLNPETAATSPYLPGGGVKDANAIAPATASVPEQ